VTGAGLSGPSGGLSAGGTKVIEAKVVLLGDSGVGKSSIA
jgi:GTPase SAR1 family protein